MSDLKSNQKYSLPRYLGKGGLLPRRSYFLKQQSDENDYPGQEFAAPGTPDFIPSYGAKDEAAMRCAYGPGQRANWVGNLGWPDPTPGNPHPDSQDSAYKAPTRWPAAGSLLRVPQVVWLSCVFPDITRNSTYTEQWPNSRRGFCWDGNPYPIDSLWDTLGCGMYFETASAYSASTGKYPTKDEYDRIREIFNEVKTAIESIRPNRTYIEIINWFGDDTNPAPNPTSIWNFLTADSWIHLSCPDVGAEFFGTNFLHIYIGSPVEDRFIEENNYVRIYQTNNTDVAANTSHQQSVARVQANYEAFAGYRVMIYTYEDLVSWQTPLPGYNHSFINNGVKIVDSAQYNAIYSQLIVVNGMMQNPQILNGYAFPSDEDYYRSLEATTTKQLIGKITSINSLPGIEAAGVLETFQQSVEIIGEDYGITIEGKSSGISSASDLINKIASHFGFDPSTGKDLG